MSGKKGMRHYPREEVCYNVHCAIKSGANSLGAIQRLTGYDYSTIKRHCKKRLKIPVGKKGRPKGTFEKTERIEERDKLIKQGQLSLRGIAQKLGGISGAGIYYYIRHTGLYDDWRQERKKYWEFRD